MFTKFRCSFESLIFFHVQSGAKENTTAWIIAIFVESFHLIWTKLVKLTCTLSSVSWILCANSSLSEQLGYRVRSKARSNSSIWCVVKVVLHLLFKNISFCKLLKIVPDSDSRSDPSPLLLPEQDRSRLENYISFNHN